MKKLLLASAVAALSVSAANAAPTVYGKVFLSLDVIDSDFTDSTDVSLNSTASRIGLKGSEALTANTDVIYQLEYVVNPDERENINGDRADQFESRDTYIGFANNTVGTFKFGRNSSITDGINNVQQAFGGIQGTVSGDYGISDGNRVDNSMIWTAPTASLPVELNLMASTEENYPAGKAGYGASVMFDQGTGYTLGLAYTDKLEGNRSDVSAEVLRATATYDMAKTMGTPVKLGVMYQQAEWNDAPANFGEKEKELMVTAAYDLVNTPWTLWAEFDQAKDVAGVNDADVTKIAVGGRYAFTKAATGHIYAGNTKFEGDAYRKLVDGTATRTKGDEFMIGTGIEYKF